MQTRLFLGLLGLFLASCVPESEQTTPAVGEWHHAGGSHFSDKYSPLDQLNSRNFSELEISWRWQSIDVRYDARDIIEFQLERLDFAA